MWLFKNKSCFYDEICKFIFVVICWLLRQSFGITSKSLFLVFLINVLSEYMTKKGIICSIEFYRLCYISLYIFIQDIEIEDTWGYKMKMLGTFEKM